MSGNQEPVLKLRTPDGLITEFPLVSDRITIGRSSKNDVQLPTADVSRVHAELVRDPTGQWWVRDLDSAGGTEVNNVPMSEAMITGADLIRIGPYELAMTSSEGVDALAAHPPLDGAAALADDASDTRVSGLGGDGKAIDVMHLTAVREFGTRLVQTSDVGERLRLLCRVVVRKEFHGTAAVVLRVKRDAKGRTRPPEQLCEPQLAKHGGKVPYISRSLVDTVMSTGLPFMAKQGKADPQAVQMTMVEGSEQSGIVAMACPLRAGANEIDLLYAVFPRTYGDPSWLVIVSMLCQQFQQAEAMRKVEDAKRAETVVRKLYEQAQQLRWEFAPELSEIEGLDVSVFAEVCPWVGGDLSDVVIDAKGNVVIVVGEVNGTGIPASYRVGCASAMIRSFLNAGLDLAATLTHVDQQVKQTMRSKCEARLTCVSFNVTTGRFDWALAGGMPLMRVDRDGQCRAICESGGEPLGRGHGVIERGEGELPPGAALLLYSDGMTKIPPGLEGTLGIGRLCERAASMVQHYDDITSAKIIAELRRAIGQVLGRRKLQDDQTLILARRPLP
ncbi:MAG: SpoIIE family protein phosphatase [Phycisphaera sp.]|nr:SpoIIE family protein phosphatase [Phycisphaera sp.]